MLKEMPLQELRAARELTQQSLAEIMDVSQAEVSKIERRTDVYVSTLARFIEAMGAVRHPRGVPGRGPAHYPVWRRRQGCGITSGAFNSLRCPIG